MPIINIQLLAGRNEEQKRKLVKEVTDAVCRALDHKPESVRIILSDMQPCDYAVGGVLKKDEVK